MSNYDTGHYCSNRECTEFDKEYEDDLDYCKKCGEVMTFNKCRNGCDEK